MIFRPVFETKASFPYELIVGDPPTTPLVLTYNCTPTSVSGKYAIIQLAQTGYNLVIVEAEFYIDNM